MAFGSPQDVEVLVDGAWVPGAMLGWRHDDTGGCEALVRTRAAGVDADAGTWTGLTAVRLPQRQLAVAPMAAAPVTAAHVTAAPVDGPVSPGGASDHPHRPHRHGADVTAEMPAVASLAGGRHRAPSRSGPGRHRAVTAELPAAVGAPAPASADATVIAAAATGPAAGTATPAAAAAAAPAAAPAAVPAAVPAAAASPGVPPVPAPAEEHDLRTRRIRLGDLVPCSRGGRPAVRPPV